MTLDQANMRSPGKKARAPKKSPAERAAEAEARERAKQDKKRETERRKQERAERKQLEAERKKQEAERKKQEAERKKQETERKKQEAERKKQEAERKKQVAAERKRLEAERKKQEAERKKQEAERKKQEAAEAKNKETQSPAFFRAMLEKARSPSNQLLGMKDVARKVAKPQREPFTKYWEARATAGALPPGIGSLLVKSGEVTVQKIFLLSDVVPKLEAIHSPSEARASARPSLTLRDRLLGEFDRLHEAGGGRYYVSLFDLRSALRDVSRAEFDAALNALRKDWILTLNPAEGRHGSVPREVLDAGITEDGRLLVYAARREA